MSFGNLHNYIFLIAGDIYYHQCPSSFVVRMEQPRNCLIAIIHKSQEVYLFHVKFDQPYVQTCRKTQYPPQKSRNMASGCHISQLPVDLTADANDFIVSILLARFMSSYFHCNVQRVRNWSCLIVVWKHTEKRSYRQPLWHPEVATYSSTSELTSRDKLVTSCCPRRSVNYRIAGIAMVSSYRHNLTELRLSLPNTNLLLTLKCPSQEHFRLRSNHARR